MDFEELLQDYCAAQGAMEPEGSRATIGQAGYLWSFFGPVTETWDVFKFLEDELFCSGNWTVTENLYHITVFICLA